MITKLIYKKFQRWIDEKLKVKSIIRFDSMKSFDYHIVTDDFIFKLFNDDISKNEEFYKQAVSVLKADKSKIPVSVYFKNNKEKFFVPCDLKNPLLGIVELKHWDFVEFAKIAIHRKIKSKIKPDVALFCEKLYGADWIDQLPNKKYQVRIK